MYRFYKVVLSLFLTSLIVVQPVWAGQPNAKRIQFEPLRNPDVTGGQSSIESKNVQYAIEEVSGNVAVSASPGFGWGGPGSSGPGQYLYNEGVESNKVGRLVPFDGYIFRFFFLEKKNTGTRTLELRRRTTPGTGAWTTIATVTATGSTPYGNVTFPAPPAVGSVSVNENEELSVRVANSSNDFEDVIVGVIIKN